jgi:endonuclease III related protein
VPRLGDSRLRLLDTLVRQYGPLPPPGAGVTSVDPTIPFESIIAVALELIVDPRTASRVFDGLKDAGLLDPEELAGADPFELGDLLEQAGARLSPSALRPLQQIARWVSEREFDSEAVERLSTEAIREVWRAFTGVGQLTADAWLLFGLKRPTYPVDRASYRILVRHGWLDSSTEYDEARSVLESIAPDDPPTLAQLSRAFVKLGRDFCKVGKPRCDRCPLARFLPDDGPIEGP